MGIMNAIAGKKGNGMSRMLMMMPMVMLIGKVDMKNADNLFYARLAWAGTVIAISTVFKQIQAKIKRKNDTTVMYVAPSAGAGASVTHIRTTYCEHEIAQAQAFLSQVMVGGLVMVAVHYFMAVAILPLMQAVMGPINAIDNTLFKLYIMGQQQEKPWDELSEAEFAALGDKATADQGDAPKIAAAPKNNSKAAPKKNNSKKKGGAKGDPALDAAICGAWDSKVEADLAALFTEVADSVSYQTPDSQPDGKCGWSALMVAAGSPVERKQQIAALQSLVEAGANLKAVDSEGWSAFHWACFHDRPGAARWLLDLPGGDALSKLKDGEGKTGAELAAAEENSRVVDVCDAFARVLASGKYKPEPIGLRQRVKKQKSEQKEEVVAAAPAAAAPAVEDNDIHDVD